MLRIPVIDLGSQWTHRIWRTLKYLGADTQIVPINSDFSKLNADAFVLSGGAISIQENKGSEIEPAGVLMDEISGPVLGICAGHQYMGLNFGGKAQPSKNPEYGKVEIIIDNPGELFDGIPGKFIAWASHNDEVVDVPNFRVLAHSKDCTNHAMQHKTKPFFGCLFHPEVEHTQHGSDIYKNFTKLVKK